MNVQAPAKLNLTLKILNRRPDGYHELETIIAALALSDRITISQSGAPGHLEFQCNEPDLPIDESNLVVKAVTAFRKATAIPTGLKITLVKNIPHGAGLGGGSSDAAATLLALNKMHDSPLSKLQLSEIAASLGSDVPFFLTGGLALCHGRGEKVTPMTEPIPDWSLLLIKPPFGISTPWAYQSYAKTHNDTAHATPVQKLDDWNLFNDLEAPVFSKYLPLAELKGWLRQQPEVRAAMMSGSGSTIFAILGNGCASEDFRQRVVQRYGDTFWVMPTTLDTKDRRH